jgi:hypothetical protein
MTYHSNWAQPGVGGRAEAGISPCRQARCYARTSPLALSLSVSYGRASCWHPLVNTPTTPEKTSRRKRVHAYAHTHAHAYACLVLRSRNAVRCRPAWWWCACCF